MYDIENPPPIPFDKLLEGRSISDRTSPLFRLPIEILNNIGSYLPTCKRDLAKLALVNTDFRQLARAYQFSTIELDHKASSINLFKLIAREAVERHQNQGRTKTFSIGVCVRRVVINYKIEWEELAGPNQPYSDSFIEEIFDEFVDDDEEMIAQDEPIEDKSDEDRSDEDRSDEDRSDEDRSDEDRSDEDKPGNLLNEEDGFNILFVISSLIHLEILDIETTDMNQNFLKTLASLPVKYLSIRNALVCDFIPKMDILEWRIESFDINLSWDYYYENLDMSSMNLFNNWEVALRSCAPFVQVLKICHVPDPSDEFRQKFISTTIEFPRLRHLELVGSQLSLGALRSLLLTSSYLTDLGINYDVRKDRYFLDSQCHIKSMKTLIMRSGFGEELQNVSFDFFKINMHLEGLGFEEPEPQTLLERVLVLLKDFRCLKMLSMTWEGIEIPESSLEKLASLTQLENLHISASDYRIGWVISHQTILKRLKPLKRLKRLSFYRDLYYYTINGTSTKFNDEHGDISNTTRNLHYQHILEKALVYANTFPDLELLHIGIITVEIFRLHGKIKLKVTENKEFSWENEIFRIRL